MAAFEPYTGTRQPAAWDAAAALLRNDEWVSRDTLIDAMVKASGIARNSCGQLLTSAAKAGWVYAGSGNRIRVSDHGREARSELRRPEVR